jgi:SAM-dependent methyltransferase
MITKFKLYEAFNSAAEVWDDFIDKVNIGIISKDPPDVKNIDKLTSIKGSGDVLDISVGDGSNSEYFIENGYNVYGTDISPLAIKTIEEKYPQHTWIVHDTENSFPFGDNKFDIIFSRLSIHYFSQESVSNILGDIYRILKPGGVLFIMVKITEVGNIDTGKKQHSKESWIQLVDEQFEIVETKSENRKAYTFEKAPSNLLEIIAKK